MPQGSSARKRTTVARGERGTPRTRRAGSAAPSTPASAAPPARAAAQVEPKTLRSPGVASISDMESAIAFLLARVNLERLRPTPATRDLYKLDRMRAILKVLDDPHEKVRCVHVAGTKGKGSTCEVIATCLESCGYAVGLYTSPHLVDIRERIRINRKLVSEADFVSLARRTGRAAAGLAPDHGEATFFELVTAMGFLHFAEQAVDAAVVEVGLGGKLDCTNVITPEVAAVATIGLDHTQILGDTVEEIAAQKAGIFKPGVPALAIQQDSKIVKVLRAEAQRIGAPLQIVGSDLDFTHRFEHQPGVGPTARVSLTTPHANYEHVAVPLPGEYQALNCGLALAVLDQLAQRGFSCPEDRVLRGLERVALPGRFELALKSPRLLLDVAHNVDSIAALMKAIGAYQQYDSLIVVFGCAADKDIPGMMRALAGGADKVIFTRASDHSRGAEPRKLEAAFHAAGGKMSQTAPTLRDALDLAGRAVGRSDLICVTGSFFMVGETKRLLDQSAARRQKK